MNYKSISVPVVAERLIYNQGSIEETLRNKYVEEVPRVGSGRSSVQYRLKEQYGWTHVPDGYWLVEFPNGEIHVVSPARFEERFQHVQSYTPEEVKNAVSMARRWQEMGGETS